MDDALDLSAFDPECLYRAIALALATFSDTSKDHHKIMAKAEAFHEFIDPLGMRWEGECDEDDGKLRVEFHPARKPG